MNRDEIREAVRQLAVGGYLEGVPGRTDVTSDLTVDEALILHSIGWEPVGLVCGAAAWSIPTGYWTWGNGEITPASQAHMGAVEQARRNLESECRQFGGHGVVGVHIDVTGERHFVNAVMVGTAVAPAHVRRAPATVFVSDLSGRDFAVLHRAGWDPVGLAFGAAFVFAPRRSAGTVLRQSAQNVELTNFTEALYDARETAMERMQSAAAALGGEGVVAVQVSEGPMSFAAHAIRFTAWGTVVRRSERVNELDRPQVVVPLDDPTLLFEAQALRGDPGR